MLIVPIGLIIAVGFYLIIDGKNKSDKKTGWIIVVIGYVTFFYFLIFGLML